MLTQFVGDHSILWWKTAKEVFDNYSRYFFYWNTLRLQSNMLIILVNLQKKIGLGLLKWRCSEMLQFAILLELQKPLYFSSFFILCYFRSFSPNEMNEKLKIIISYRNLCKSHEVTNFPRYKDESQMWSIALMSRVFLQFSLHMYLLSYNVTLFNFNDLRKWSILTNL